MDREKVSEILASPAVKERLAAARISVSEAVERARERLAAMTPEERAEHDRLQRRSWYVGESAMGNDEQEAAYRAALFADDQERLAVLRAEIEERARQAGERFDAMFPPREVKP